MELPGRLKLDQEHVLCWLAGPFTEEGFPYICKNSLYIAVAQHFRSLQVTQRVTCSPAPERADGGYVPRAAASVASWFFSAPKLEVQAPKQIQ